ncbi:DNA sulfur modification protein DndD [Marinococcus halophilus]|uniref:DNA sulfur modification protein DndD n=1 Tax=Marinococcus halophilus TaxID=1371 RepID=UPI0009A9077A|nr:DNA sulfur modification protein DndD [Marinococcus halophilus]
MLLNKVTLENIGPYRNIHTFDLSVNSSEKNVVLIGGENGAGKTTLLNSIKIGLFGPFNYGYKTENQAYYDKIWSFLNKDLRNKNEQRFRIILEYNEIENYELNNYQLYRSWKVNNGKIKEELDIIKNERHLNEFEKELYQTKLRETMPPQLFDLCLFDGEEISKVINEDLLSDYLKNASIELFGLNLFEQLESDLKQYVKKDIDQKSISTTEKELMDLYQKEENIKNTILNLNETLSNKKKSLADFEHHSMSLKKDFDLNGGLAKKERDTLINQVNEIENQRKNNSETVKDFITTLLPFYLNKDLLFEAKQQISEEETHEFYLQLSERLDLNTTEEIISTLPFEKTEINNHQFRNAILDEFKSNNVDLIQKASFSQRSLLESLCNQLQKEDFQKYLNLIKSNQNQLEQSKKLRDQINKNDNSSEEFNKIIQDIENTNREIIGLEQEVHQLEQELEESQNELTLNQNNISDKKHEISQFNKKKNTFSLSNDIIEISKEFRSIQQQKKLQQVQFEATRMLNKLMRKQKYISSLHIDHVTYEVTLRDNNNDILAKENLSAGEKQILLLSIIWAMFKCSGSRLPFIYDTLLSRLDKTHKYTVLTELIPLSGEQVLILSTDTEIEEKHYNLLKSHLSHEYTLEFNTTNQNIDVHKEYFKFKESELKA